jgi:hypothetical protein
MRAVMLLVALAMFVSGCGCGQCISDRDCKGGLRCVQDPPNPKCDQYGSWPCYSDSCWQVCPRYCLAECDGGCDAHSTCASRLAMKDIGDNYDNVWTDPIQACVPRQ